jgi:hypothetical protein
MGDQRLPTASEGQIISSENERNWESFQLKNGYIAFLPEFFLQLKILKSRIQCDKIERFEIKEWEMSMQPVQSIPK